MAATKKSNALIILYDGFNTLDVNGPLEVLRKSGISQTFDVTIASETDITTSCEGLLVKRHIPLDEALIDRLHEYDVLVIPGADARGPDSPIQTLAARADGPFMRLIEKYTALPPVHHDGNDGNDGELAQSRLLLSICTGAIFLAKLGVFNDARLCTTHWAFYDVLAEFNAAAAAAVARSAGPHIAPGKVVPSRFVDSGLYRGRVRIVTSGGVSCGMDAALHVVRLRAGEAEALSTAEMLDYAWRKTDGLVVGDTS